MVHAAGPVAGGTGTAGTGTGATARRTHPNVSAMPCSISQQAVVRDAYIEALHEWQQVAAMTQVLPQCFLMEMI